MLWYKMSTATKMNYFLSSSALEVMFFRSFIVLSSALSLVVGTVLPAVPRSLPTGTVTCGSNGYSPSQLTAAINAGVKDLTSGDLQGEFHYYYQLHWYIEFWCTMVS